MKKSAILFAFVAMAGASTLALADYPVMDMVASKIIQKYQTATCQQLWEEKAAGKKPQSQREQDAIAMLRSDDQMRAAFFQKISAPIVSKMFECGMIP
jgi:hypothetical protein